MPLSIAWRRKSSPAPGVEGGNDGLHGDELIMGEAVDKEDGGPLEEVLVWSVGQRSRLSSRKDREEGFRIIAPLNRDPVMRWNIVVAASAAWESGAKTPRR